MLDLGVEKFFQGANSGGGLAEVGNKRSSTGKCEFPCLTSGRTFGLILVIGVVIGMVAGSLGTPFDGKFAVEGVRKLPAVIQITLGVCDLPWGTLGARGMV